MDFILANLWLVSLIAAVIALVFVGLQAKKVLAEDEGSDLMKRISQTKLFVIISFRTSTGTEMLLSVVGRSIRPHISVFPTPLPRLPGIPMAQRLRVLNILPH